MGGCAVIRNTITLTDDDAWTVVSALEELLDYIDMYGDKHSRITDRRIDELTELKQRIESAIK